MATETGSLRTRRALLGAALGGAAAAAVSAAAPMVARGTDGQPALLGTANQSTTPTGFENTDAGETSLIASHAGAGTALKGTSVTGTGIVGNSSDTTPTVDSSVTSHKTGVIGVAGDITGIVDNSDETGVYGYAALSDVSNGVWGDSALGNGVVGTGFTGVAAFGDWGLYASGSTSVIGDSGSAGLGVYGFAGDSAIPIPPSYGIGVYARAEPQTAVALEVVGKARFSRSKRVAIGATKTSLKVTMAGVTTASYVLATLQTSVTGCYVRAVVPAAGSFTIYLSKAPGKTVYVGYMVIN